MDRRDACFTLVIQQIHSHRKSQSRPTQEELSSSEPFTSAFRDALPLEAKLERARTELLDLSARNRLLNIPRSAKNGRTIEVIDEKSKEIYRLMVEDGKAFNLPSRS